VIAARIVDFSALLLAWDIAGLAAGDGLNGLSAKNCCAPG
jgi:hypothetical protein